MICSESTKAFGHPRLTKPTFGIWSFLVVDSAGFFTVTSRCGAGEAGHGRLAVQGQPRILTVCENFSAPDPRHGPANLLLELIAEGEQELHRQSIAG